MRYESLTKELDEISKVIHLNNSILEGIMGEDKLIFKKSVHKNLIIEIYTFWENYVKKIMYNCYENYKKIIVDREFIVNYIQQVQEKSYTRQLFLASLDENKLNITIENLCYSNNLNYKELNSLFKRLLFKVDDFNKHIDKHPALDRVINELKLSGIDPVFKIVKSRYETSEYVEAYLNLLVENRNIVAHQYELTDIYNLAQFEKIRDFVKELADILYEYCGSQLIKKAKQKSECIYKRFLPIKVIKGNSAGKTAIIGIRNISLRKIGKDSKLYCYDKNKDIYRTLSIINLKKENKECNEILPLESYSMEVYTNTSLNNKYKNFIIYDLDKRCDDYTYSIIV